MKFLALLGFSICLSFQAQAAYVNCKIYSVNANPYSEIFLKGKLSPDSQKAIELDWTNSISSYRISVWQTSLAGQKFNYSIAINKSFDTGFPSSATVYTASLNQKGTSEGSYQDGVISGGDIVVYNCQLN